MTRGSIPAVGALVTLSALSMEAVVKRDTCCLVHVQTSDDRVILSILMDVFHCLYQF
jgi:hypothetical protein